MLVLVERTAEGLDLAVTPVLLAAESVTNPFVAFARAPRIVVPASLAPWQWESQLSQALMHECGHIARLDLPIRMAPGVGQVALLATSAGSLLQRGSSRNREKSSVITWCS